MNSGSIALFSGIKDRMSGLSQRQKVVSENIANSETPGFRARDVKSQDFSSLLNSVSSGASSAGVSKPTVQITSRMSQLGAAQHHAGNTVEVRDGIETKPNGNNVSLEMEMLKVGQIQADFTAMTNLYRKNIGLIKTAVGSGGR
ncbi:flagellar basal-body rod protein FlgB [Pacificimonas flava]|uniref:Flagellar basal body rod protein FlgB n=2 Tax=Pacificimonas TaxID=1960290 RepID=A0A219B5V2_9SPHN|nr:MULTISPECIES: flagellar basal body rod protein FlgB [Pacificimonas]MBZ6379207.1 flagellar basal body rod protein FlgB [Pacificimonas aurantium]OWV33574.1 flagellar basal-body rod protein FlgB [Pacificimonas flava]